MKWIEEKQALYRRNQELVEKVRPCQAASESLTASRKEQEFPCAQGFAGSPRCWAVGRRQRFPSGAPAGPSVLLTPMGLPPRPTPPGTGGLEGGT